MESGRLNRLTARVALPHVAVQQCRACTGQGLFSSCFRSGAAFMQSHRHRRSKSWSEQMIRGKGRSRWFRPVVEGLEDRITPHVFNPTTVAQLIADINTANTNNEADVINLAAGSTYPLTAVNNTSARGPNGLPVLLPDNGNALVFNGNGATLIRANGSPNFRFFQIEGGDITFNDLTLKNGNPAASLPPAGNGGAISQFGGTVTLNNSTLSGNAAQNGGAVYVSSVNSSAFLNVNRSTLTTNRSYQSGGAVAANSQTFPLVSTLTITSSTLSFNNAQLNGGAVFAGASNLDFVNLTNSTVSGNKAALASTGANGGGGLAGNYLTILNSTVTDNEVVNQTAQGGGILGSITMRNSIVAGNRTRGTAQNLGADIRGGGTSNFSLIGTAASGSGFTVTGSGNFFGVNPLLGPLQDNGGTVETHALAAASLAVDNGDPAFAPPPSTDERGAGFNRVINGRLDIGAYEYQPPATTSSIVSAIPSSPTPFGTAITITATVSGNAANSNLPHGIVTFMDGATVLGPAALADVGGVATAVFTTAPTQLTVGMHAITAVYSGATLGNPFNASTSTALSFTVNAASTTTTVAASPNPSTVGQPVTITATVQADAPSTATPLGMVTFLDNGTPIGTAVLSGGTATLIVSNLPAGTRSLTAVYAGDGNFSTSTSTAFSQTVNPAATTVSLVGSGSPTVYGQNVTFTATVTVTAPGAGTPTGTITFRDGATIIATIGVSGGVAVFATTSLSVGAHSITATYNGDTNFNASPASAAVPHTVNAAAATTALAGSGSPTVFGQSVTFTATVSVIAPGGGIPTGTVTFRDGATFLATVSLVGTTAVFTTSNLGVGPHSMTATYNGDTNFSASPASSAVAQQVNPAGTMTTLVISGSPTIFGQTVVFTAAVAASAPGSGTPTGTITFFDGATPLGTVNLAGGNASLVTSALPAGSHSITATYNGDSNFATSTSAATAQQVNPAATQTTVTAAPNPGTTGQPVTFTALVLALAPGNGTPTGTVDFFDGSTLLGSATLSGGTASFTTSALTASSHSITAVFVGSADFSGSTSIGLDVVVSTGGPTPPTPPTATRYLAVGTDAGVVTQVNVYDSVGQTVLASFQPFGPGFTGGARVAVGDVNNDGITDIVVGAGPGGGPQVRVFDGRTFTPMAGALGSFFGLTPSSFTGGLFVAVGDVNGDRFGDIIVGADAGGGPQVTVFSGRDGGVLRAAFNAMPAGFSGGVRVAAGDVNGDGRIDIITAAGIGGGPQVTVFDGSTLAQLTSFFAFGTPAFTGGVYLTAGDVNGDGRADIISGAGAGGGPQVAVYSGPTQALLASFFALPSRFTGGVRVGAVTGAPGSRANVVVGAGPGASPQVTVFDTSTLNALSSFFANSPQFTNGVFVAG